MPDPQAGGYSPEEGLSRMGSDRSERWLTPASIGISVVIVGILAYYLPYLYMKLNLRATAGGYLPVLAISPFLVLLVINGVLRRLGIGLSRGEITVVLCSMMVSFSTLVMMVWMMTTLPAPVRSASPQNDFVGRFLWAIDTRLMPYRIEDKEREKTAGQYEENLNWYYMGIPRPLSEEVLSEIDAESRARAAGGGAERAGATGIDEGYNPNELKIPWWRWIRRQNVDLSERRAAYDRLGERIRKTEGLEPAAVQSMLAEVENLKQGFGAFEKSNEAYARLFALLREAPGLDPKVRRELGFAIQNEKDFDRHRTLDLRVRPDRRDTDRPWFLWTGPLVWWLVLLFLFVILQFCIVALLRRQWVDHEKLLFPHVEILEATTAPGPTGTPGGSIVRNRLMWIGFGLAFLLFASEGLNTYVPAVPGLQLKEFSLRDVLTEDPWRAIPKELDLHVFIIAIAFILPAEISFSIWVFVLVDFAVRVYLAATGQTYHVTEPITGYLINEGSDQVAGLTVFILALLYGGRRHFIGVIRKAFLRDRGVDDSEEPLPYFGAFWGLVLSGAGIILWCYIMGMSPLISLMLFGLTVFGIMFVTRVVCELGIVTAAYQDPSAPQYLIAGTLGYRPNVGRMTLWNRLMFMTPTYSTWAYIWPVIFFGTNVMPLAMTSERMFRHGPSRRRFTFFLLVLTLAVMAVFAVQSIRIPYEEGAGVRLKQGRFNGASHDFNNCLVRDFIVPQKMHKPYPPIYWSGISGVIVMSLLLTLRHLFYWWPLHPIGYICAGPSAGVWFSVFIGWFIKRAMLKYGGGKLFRNAIPFFVGLLIGHFAIAGIWQIVGVIVEARDIEGIYSAIWSLTAGAAR